jgi:selenocysteine lyase/cysteine desulfurase
MPTSDRPPRTGRPLRELFPVLEQGHYLNHAAIAPWPLPVAEAVQQFAAENLRRGPRDYPAWIRREQSLRRQLAELAGAVSPDDISLLKNTTEGISLVAWGLDWRPGDNLVLPRGEFTSNRLPWLAQASRGVEIREVDIREMHGRGADKRGGRDAEAALIAAMDRKTRLLSVSAVQWSDGFRLDLGRLGEACQARDVLFFVDAIQQLGALQLSVEESRIDFLAADAHKWLLGPEGIALFYSRPAARERLALLQQGWHMFEQPWHFQRDDWTPAASGKRFEAGSPNSVGQAALHAAAGLLLERGMRSVEARVLQNTAYLVARLDGMPAVRLVSDSAPARRSGIVSFSCERVPARELHRRLAARDVVCALRGDAIRLSPHYYQGEEELEAFVRELEGSL